MAISIRFLDDDANLIKKSAELHNMTRFRACPQVGYCKKLDKPAAVNHGMGQKRILKDVPILASTARGLKPTEADNDATALAIIGCLQRYRRMRLSFLS